MGQLVIMRHGYALFPDPGKSDFDRELAQNGIEEAQQSARQLLALGIVPDRIICSTAKRARQTLDAIMPILKIDPEKVEYRAALYQDSVDSYFEIARGCRNGSSAMIVGHNPMIETCITALADGGDENGLNELAYGFGTGYIAVLGADDGDTFELDTLITPTGLN